MRDMKNVKIYSTPACPFCIKAKQYLKDNNVTFEDLDVSSDQNLVSEMVEKSGQMGVPVLDIEGEIIVGFDKDKISQALGI
jgi:glutaredoxin 3